jgi:hypothetical protein
MSEFKLLGPRILLTLPQINKPTLQLSEELERQWMEKEMQKFNKLEVFAIGTEVTGVEVGDSVTVNPLFIRNAERVNIEGEDKVVIRYPDITIVWKRY